MPTPSGKATAALVLGIIGLITSCIGVGIILGIVALILGILAISDIDRSNGQLSGRGKAQTGAILGGITLVLVPVLIVVAMMAGIMVPAFGAANRAAYKMKNGTQMCAMGKNMILWSDQFYQQSEDFPKAGLSPDPTSMGKYAHGIPTNSVEDRLGAVVNMGSDTLEPTMLVNPVGTEKAAGGSVGLIVLQQNNISYALLDAENKEWKNKTNANAPLGCDRQVGAGSHWNKNHWEGNVLWGDTHVTYEVPFGSGGGMGGYWPSTTINGTSNSSDDLFHGDTGPEAHDAVLINP